MRAIIETVAVKYLCGSEQQLLLKLWDEDQARRKVLHIYFGPAPAQSSDDLLEIVGEVLREQGLDYVLIGWEAKHSVPDDVYFIHYDGLMWTHNEQWRRHGSCG